MKYKETLIKGLTAMGCQLVESDSRYVGFSCPLFQSGDMLFVGSSGALRKGRAVSYSKSIGNPSRQTPFYHRVLKAAELGKDPGKQGMTHVVHWTATDSFDGKVHQYWQNFPDQASAQAYLDRKPEGKKLEPIANCPWHPNNKQQT